jgi:nucleotide-binding universal stress UspA family protein
MKRHLVLVPLDGSPLARRALPYAATLARAMNEGVELLAVSERLGYGPEARRLESLIEEGLHAHLHTVAEELRTAGLAVETAVRSGDPADTILGHAEKVRARAVVMTTRGHSGVTRWLIGGVADKVMRTAPCPVLLARPGGPEAQPPAWQPRRIMVPLDGSPASEDALAPAYELAAAVGAAVALVRVQPYSAARLAIFGSHVLDVARMDEIDAHNAAAYLERVAAAAPAGIEVETAVPRGDPAEQLIEYAERDDVDLVVMTSHGRAGVQRMMLGSVADRLIRHGLPAYVIRTTTDLGATPSSTAVTGAPPPP